MSWLSGVDCQRGISGMQVNERADNYLNAYDPGPQLKAVFTAKREAFHLINKVTEIG